MGSCKGKYSPESLLFWQGIHPRSIPGPLELQLSLPWLRGQGQERVPCLGGAVPRQTMTLIIACDLLLYYQQLKNPKTQ